MDACLRAWEVLLLPLCWTISHSSHPHSIVMSSAEESGSSYLPCCYDRMPDTTNLKRGVWLTLAEVQRCQSVGRVWPSGAGHIKQLTSSKKGIWEEARAGYARGHTPSELLPRTPLLMPAYYESINQFN